MKSSKEVQNIANKIVKFIGEHDNFLLSAHVNADGDAVASVIAMRLLLNKLGKRSVMVLHDAAVDPRYDFLADFQNIHSMKNGMDFRAELGTDGIRSAIILDVPGHHRLGDVSRLLPDKAHIIKIDHHPLEDEMGAIEWVDVSSSSTAAMVYEVAEATAEPMDAELAKAIFTGIIYDTGRFSFSNTRARDFYIASRLVAAGVEPSEITNRVFFENSFEALKTIGAGLSSLEHYLNGRVNVIYLSHRELAGSKQNEIEELANYTVAVRGGKVGLFIREIEPGTHKISLRSHSHVDVNQVAKAFDGGGHTRAAGCRISGSKDEVIRNLLQEIEKQL